MFHRILTLATLAMLLLAACASPAGQSSQTGADGGAGSSDGSTEVRVGAVWSLSGNASIYGAVQKNAADLAVDEINSSGLLGDKQIKLLVEDDRSVKEGAITAFEKLINQDKVVAILGPTLSNSAVAADPIAQGKGVVVLGVSNTAAGIVEIGDYIFRNSLPESAVQPNTVKVTKERFGYTKVALMYGDDDAYTKAGYDVFKQALESSGVQILTVETFKKGDTDFSAQLTKIKGLNPDAIFLSALAEDAAGIISQARQLGIASSVPFIGGNGLNSPKLAELAGTAAEGAISGAAWFVSNDTPGNQAFVQNYRERYGSEPDQFAAQAYAGVYILANAIKNASAPDSAAIRDALAKTKDLPTVLGSFSFDEQGDPIHEPVVQVVRNGKFELFR